EPLGLGGGRGACDPTAGRAIAARVQHDDVPAAPLVAVVALARVAGGSAEVAEVPGRARGGVLAVAGRGHGPGPEGAPERVVPLRELGRGAVLVDVVAQGGDGPRPLLHEGGGVRSRAACVRVAGDVARRAR